MLSPTSTPRRSAPLHGLVLGVTLASGPAHANAQPGTACADDRLRVEGSLAVRWLEPVVALCESWGSLPDVDPSARLRVVAADDDVIVEVTLRDGRSTLRRVRVPGDLPQTVEALVAIPPVIPGIEQAAPVAAAPAPAVTPVAVPDAAPAGRMTLELGASVVARVTGPTQYVSIGASGYAGLRTGPWLLALTGRYDGYQTVTDDRPRDFEMTTLGGGFSLMRELAAFEHSAFELGLTTWLLGETQAYTPDDVELAYSSFDVRLGATTRWVLGDRPLRYFVGFDAELSPARMRHELRVEPGLPALPGWSVGLAIGVAWDPQ